MELHLIGLVFLNGLVQYALADPSGYIIGGQDSKPGQWPWQAMLLVDGKYACGAALVTDNALLTAAHCLNSVQGDMSRVTIKLGVYNMYDDSQGKPEVYSVARSAQEPGEEDIAVLVLSSRVSQVNSFIKPIKMPADSSAEYGGRNCWATGWGYNSDLVVQSVLQEAQVDVLTYEDCLAKYGRVIETSFVCAIDVKEESKGICLGDSGGPLSCEVDGEWYVAGVASWTFGLCATHLPSIFVRVSDYVNWIDDVITS